MLVPIRPVRYNQDGTIEVWHDERGHGGTVTEDAFTFATDFRGSDGLRYLEIACPVPGCDSTSLHPASGGCDPDRIPEIFVRLLQKVPPRATSAALSNPAVRTRAEAIDALEVLAQELDGPERAARVRRAVE